MTEVPTTIEAAGRALRAGVLTSTALTDALLERIEHTNAALGAFVTVTADAARSAAAVADRELADGHDRGPLHGIPLAIKDIIATADAPTTANSRAIAPDWGRGIDAPVVARLREAGAVLVGKATTSEYATGTPDPTTGFPIPRNPWNVEHTASGSSSGTGVAIAAGLALGGLGTDTGGSVRGPASVMGLTGLKVTFGRVPKSGVVPLAATLDSVGPMARTALDCASLLEVIAGHDPGDPHAAAEPVPRYRDALSGSVEGVRVGVPVPYFLDHPKLDPEVGASVRAAVEALAGAGALVADTEVPEAERAYHANTIVGGGECFAYHHLALRDRWTDYGRNTRTNLVRGAFSSAADHIQANRFRAWFRREVARLLVDFDVLVVPSFAAPAARIDSMGLFRDYGAPSFTGQWNLAGLPAVAVPCGFSTSGLPLSLQVVGRPFAEATVLGVAHAYQQLTDWHARVAPTSELAHG